MVAFSDKPSEVSQPVSSYRERRLAQKYALYPYVLFLILVVGSFFASLAIGYNRVSSSEKFSEYNAPFIPKPLDAGADTAKDAPKK